MGYPWKAPDITPNADGGIDLLWESASRRLLVMLNPSRSEVKCVVRLSGSAPRLYETTNDAIPGYVAWVLAS